MPAYIAGPQNIVVVLTSKTDVAYNALFLEHNKKFVPPPTVILDLGDSVEDSMEDSVEDDVEDRHLIAETAPLRETWFTITLDDPPYDPFEGWVCGSDPEECFMLLNEQPSGGGISQKHFSLDYNWENGSLLLKDMSSHGTTVLSKVFGNIILLGESITIETGDIIQASLVRLEVSIPDRGLQKGAYERKWRTCRDAREQAIPRIGNVLKPPPKGRTALDTKLLGLSSPIGSGSFSEVRRAVDCLGNVFAVKSFRLTGESKYIQSEQRILRELKHENIICVFDDKVVNALDSEKTPYLVMEYCQEGSLFSRGMLTPSETTVVLGQVCDGVQYMHSRGLVHRDLKPSNILLTSWAPAWVKIADFGLAQDEKFLRTFCGTPLFIAPEICYSIDDQSNLDETSSTISTVILGTTDASPNTNSTKELSATYSNKVDVWSILIMLLFYAREGDLPDEYDMANMRPFHEEILEYSQKAIKPTWTRHINLVRQCIALNPLERASVQQLQKHFADLREPGTTTTIGVRHT
ncbi:hypothetical protein LTS17_009635 [Exophiala oligosperma]